MKKLCCLLIVTLLITGCGKIKCTSYNKSRNEESIIIGKFKGKYLSKISSTEIIKLNSGTESEQLCSLVKSSYKGNNYDVTCKNRTVTIKSTTNVKKSKKVTKDTFVKEYKNMGYSCK